MQAQRLMWTPAKSLTFAIVALAVMIAAFVALTLTPASHTSAPASSSPGVSQPSYNGLEPDRNHTHGALP